MAGRAKSAVRDQFENKTDSFCIGIRGGQARFAMGFVQARRGALRPSQMRDGIEHRLAGKKAIEIGENHVFLRFARADAGEGDMRGEDSPWRRLKLLRHMRLFFDPERSDPPE